MKSERIVVFNEVGVSCDKMLKLLLGYKHENFNQFLKDAEIIKYPAPGIVDTEGHEIEATSIYQERLNPTDDWQDCVIDGYDPICRTGWEQRIIWRLSPSQKVQVKEVELPIIIQSALLHEIPAISKRTGISEVWLAVWHEVEIFYGDVQKKETREELLLRLQNQYNLRFKSPPTH